MHMLLLPMFLPWSVSGYITKHVLLDQVKLLHKMLNNVYKNINDFMMKSSTCVTTNVELVNWLNLHALSIVLYVRCVYRVTIIIVCGN